MRSDLLPIIILVGISFALFTFAVIFKIRGQKSLLIENEPDFIERLVERKKQKLNTSIGGVTWNTYIGLIILCPIGAALLGYIFLEKKALCVVMSCVALFVPEIVVRVMAKKRRKKFDEKYSMALRSLASGLRAGLTIEQAIENVGRNGFLEDSIRTGFKQIASDIRFGVPMEDAFRNFADDTQNKDAYDVAAVIAMQSKVGGSEALAISTIVQNISNRIMMRNEIKALFADTDMLVLIMDFLPFVLFAVFYFGAPQMLDPFFSSPAMTALLIGLLVFSVAGSFVIHKISKIAKEG